MSALDCLMAGEGFDAAALLEEVEALERAGQSPPPQFGEKMLAALHALCIAVAEKRDYERGLIEGYKVALTDILRLYEELLEKLIRGFGEAEVEAPLVESLLNRLLVRGQIAAAFGARDDNRGAERQKRPRGRPAEDDTPHVAEMVRIIIREENTFFDSKAVSKAANQAAEGVSRRHPKYRKDVAKTLRYKFKKTLQELKRREILSFVADFARLSIRVEEERRHRAPFGHLPNLAGVLAEHDELQKVIDDFLLGLLEPAEGQKRN
jgi:hypothetical protein